MAKTDNLNDFLKDIADAIREKTEDSGLINAQTFADKIRNVGSNAEIISDPIRFFDYDGTVLYTYSYDEAQKLRELPPVPIHDGLISMGWNYTLDEIKQMPICEIGATYVTSDNKMHFYINVPYDGFTLSIYDHFNASTDSLIIDWGDGVENLIKEIRTHVYSKAGEYIIKVYTSNNESFKYNPPSYEESIFMGYSSNLIKKVFCPSNLVSLEGAPFKRFECLEELILPPGVEMKAIGFNSNQCSAIIIPRGVVCKKWNDNTIYTAAKKLSVSPDILFNGYGSGLRFTAGPDRFVLPLLEGFTINVTSAAFSQTCLNPGFLYYNNDYNGHEIYYKNILCPNDDIIVSGMSGTSGFKNWIFNRGFVKSVQIKNISSITQKAFADMTSVENITIPETVTSIGSYCFNKSGIKNITLPNNIITVEISLFDHCTKLETITLPKNLITIRSSAFSDCISLKNIVFPENLTTIENYAFSKCECIKNVTIPNSVTNIGHTVFRNCINLETLLLPKNITDIPYSFCSGCLSLNNIDLPDGIVSIKSEAFNRCRSLKNITLPESLITIEYRAFFLNGFNKIILPENVQSIGNEAFVTDFHGENTTTIYCMSKTPPTLGSNVFHSMNPYSSSKTQSHIVAIFVPSGSENDYKSATNWSQYADKIKPIPQ